MRLARSASLAVVGALILSALIPTSASAATVQVSTFGALQSAIGGASTGDVIELQNDIVVTNTLSIATGVTIDGNGFTLSVPTPGVTEAGLNAASPSAFRVMNVITSDPVTIMDLTMMGGNATNGGAVFIDSGSDVTMNNVRIERSRNSAWGGGGISNAGTLTMIDSYLRRNSADHGGGIVNSGVLIMQGSSLVENRTESSNGGGGGVENQGTMWLINSTFAHNFTTAGGGAINNYGGTLYVAHSTFVGNVSTGPYDGGAILTFSGGTAAIASSLFAYNYSTRGSDGQFFLDDFASGLVSFPLSQPSDVTIANSLVHTADTWSAAINDSNVTDYGAAADGSTDTLFSGGSFAFPTDGTGAVVTTRGQVFRPNLVVQGGLPTAALVSLTTPGLQGAPVDFVAQVRFGYFSGATWTNLFGTASAQTPTIDQIGQPRDPATPTVGSLEGTTAQTYLVSSPVTAGGSVSGATAYGDPYPAGATVVITALPDVNYQFGGWSVSVNGGAPSSVSGSTLSLTVTGTTVVTPNFLPGVGTRTVTYTAVGADSGLPPASETSGTPIIIDSTGGTLVRAGYALTSWNTSANGSGDAYAFGDAYIDPSNLVLYPVWTVSAAPVSYVVTFDSQGGSAVAASSFVAGASIAAPLAPPTRAGFTFGGWATTAAGPPVTFPYTPGANAPLTLFAVWTAAGVGGGSTPAATSTSTLPDTGLHFEQPLAAALLLFVAGGVLVLIARRRAA